MSDGPSRMPLHLLESMTDNFSEDRALGCGAYGKVYLGEQEDGQKIAIKILHDQPGHDDVQFKKEFYNLANLQHQNIVRLVGYCHETRREFLPYNETIVLAEVTKRALCFEFMENGSLSDYLFDEFNGHGWRKRYAIIKGICNGLKYLHEELKPPIFHLDLKPPNILLDKNMIPKIADFGLSRFFKEEKSHITNSPIGTPGYLPPEFINQNIISNKLDIFSLGVVIIRIMAGPEGYSKSAEMSPEQFIEIVHENWRNRLQSAASGDLLESYSEQVKSCVEIALSCVKADRRKRPTIGDIINMLNETETLENDQGALIDQVILLDGNNVLTSMDVHPTEPWILAAYFKRLVIWNYKTQTRMMERQFYAGYSLRKYVSTVRFIAQSTEQLFVVGDGCGYIHVYECMAIKSVKEFKAHGDAVTSFAVHSTQPFVLSASYDKLIKLWNWEKGWECIRTFTGHSSWVRQVKFNPHDANTFASASDDGTVKIWRIYSPTHFTSLNCEEGQRCVDYYPTGGDQQHYIVTGSKHGTARIWDLRTETCIREIKGLQSPCEVGVIDCHPDRPAVLVTASESYGVSLQDSTTYRISLHQQLRESLNLGQNPSGRKQTIQKISLHQQLRESLNLGQNPSGRKQTIQKCERTLHFGLGKVVCFAYIKGIRSLAIGHDQGVAIMEIDGFSKNVLPPAR